MINNDFYEFLKANLKIILLPFVISPGVSANIFNYTLISHELSLHMFLRRSHNQRSVDTFYVLKHFYNSCQIKLKSTQNQGKKFDIYVQPRLSKVPKYTSLALNWGKTFSSLYFYFSQSIEEIETFVFSNKCPRDNHRI